MNRQEMKEKYHELFNMIIASNDEEKMHVLGNVAKQQMEWFIENRPEMAEEFIETLCSIKWKNYLTHKEAERIIGSMVPAAKWTKEQWKTAMNNLGLLMEEEPCYNSCALWVAMNMIYSDDIRTIADLMGKTVEDMGAEEMVRATHAFAVNKLKDADGVFNIRKYFGLQ